MSIRKLKNNCYKVTIPVYDKSFFLAFSTSDAVKLADIDLDREDFLGCVREFESGPPIVILNDFTVCTITHEIQHLL